jgi:hypothetical protein
MSAMVIEHAARSRMPAGIAQSLAMVGAQRPVPDVVTAAHQVSAVSVVVDAKRGFSPCRSAFA